MDPRTLATFRTAARTLSFTRTAELLNYAQSSITAQMKSLEQDLDVTLFHRAGNRIELTEPGRTFLDYAERLLALMDEAKGAVKGGASQGLVRFTAAETVCSYRLPAVLNAFSREHPGVRLQFVPMPVRDFKRQLLEGALAAAFVLEAPFSHTGLAVEWLHSEPVGIYAPPSHRLAGAPRVTALDLLREQYLMTDSGCSYRNQFERALIAAGAHPATRLEFQSIEAIKRCVELGMGIAPLPDIAVAEERRSGRLVRLAWAEPPLEVANHLVWNPQHQVSPSLRAFLDFCSGTMKTDAQMAPEGHLQPA
ncbi:MAG: LysR family transcriptional regulator [Holophaga sp.]|nr:LysR family transcriptional regulator [Holophaga sp.]